jgi:tetratricopeptide (TPR) repeat protein
MTDWVQVTKDARALGLEDRFAEGHALLDTVPADAGAETAVRVSLERGRLFRSAGDPATASAHFDAAVAAAASAGLDGLQVDALHMVALVAPTDQQLAAHEAALALARSSTDPDAQRWLPSLLNNLGMTYSDLGDWPAALTAFEQALAGRLEGDDAEATRVASWMVAWALRNLGRRDEAREMQRALKVELDAAGASDEYVDEELALLDE